MKTVLFSSCHRALYNSHCEISFHKALHATAPMKELRTTHPCRAEHLRAIRSPVLPLTHILFVCRTFIIPTAAQCCWNLSRYTSEPQQNWRYKVFGMVRVNYHSRSIQETRWSCNRLHVIGNSWVKKIIHYGKFCTSRQTPLNLN